MDIIILAADSVEETFFAAERDAYLCSIWEMDNAQEDVRGFR